MHNNLGKILFKKIFLWYIVIASSLTIFQIYFEYKDTKLNLHQSLQDTKNIFFKPLSNSIWNLDDEQINSNIDSILSLKHIIGISIIDMTNEVIVKSGIILNDTKDLISYKFVLTYSNEKLANVVLYSNNDVIYNSMKNNVILIIINAMLKSIVLMFLFLYFSNKLITKVLNETITTINKSSYDNFELIPHKKLNKNDITELSILIDSFNKMQKKISVEKEKNIYNNNLLKEQSKMASMGEMIGNISHQWRQPLSSISASASSMKLKRMLGTQSNVSDEKSIDAILESTKYLSNTIDDFRSFIKGESKKSIFNLKENIDSFENIIDATNQTNHINMIINIDKNIKINTLKNELNQCLINIVNNSNDALSINKIQDKYVFLSAKEENDKVIIDIKDNAGGIPKEILPKIFEIYFTTKHQSQGTGLGLHMTYKLIVEGMGGTITANNVTYDYEGKEFIGAQFIISLPI